MTLRDRCDVAEVLLTEGADAEGRAAFYRQLHEPLPSQKPDAELRRLLGV